MAAWLLWQEGGLLYNNLVVQANPWSKVEKARQAIVGLIAYLFSDGITSQDLSTFTAFFNPDSGGAFTAKDWSELMTSPAPPIDYANEVDKYWGQGPLMAGNRIVDHWWTSTEARQCTQCDVEFSLIIPKMENYGYPNGATFYFGYKP